MASSGIATELVSIALGGVMVLLGLVAYTITEFASVTALIPAVFGVLIVGLGMVARIDNYRRIALSAIGVLAILGITGSLRAIPAIFGQDWSVATMSQGLMIVLSLLLLGVVAYEFLDAR